MCCLLQWLNPSVRLFCLKLFGQKFVLLKYFLWRYSLTFRLVVLTYVVLGMWGSWSINSASVRRYTRQKLNIYVYIFLEVLSKWLPFYCFAMRTICDNFFLCNNSNKLALSFFFAVCQFILQCIVLYSHCSKFILSAFTFPFSFVFCHLDKIIWQISKTLLINFSSDKISFRESV